MKNLSIGKPIGLHRLCSTVERICQKAEVYRRSKPPHMLVELDRGCGRTTVVQYVADMYKEYNILPFKCILDNYIEVELNGRSTQNIKDSFAAFAPGYDNGFSNIAGIGITDMARYMNAPQFGDFLSLIEELCSSASVIFFVSSIPSRQEEQLIDRLYERIGKNRIERIRYEEMCQEDICQLIEHAIGEYGIVIEHSQYFHSELLQIVDILGIQTVKEALLFAERLLHYADFSRFTPVVDEKCLSVMIAEPQQTNEWRDTYA